MKFTVYNLMPGRGITLAIFIVRQLQEKYLSKKRKLYFVFVDLKKAFDRVPREELWWAMRRKMPDKLLHKISNSSFCVEVQILN